VSADGPRPTTSPPVRARVSDRARVATRARACAVALVLVALMASTSAGCGGGDGGGRDRQAEVAERGAQVMPFDLEATTHRFAPRVDGLVQTVVADDPDAADQVDLVRGHLTAEVERFAGGDFGDPASIHGDDMPGLAELSDGAGRIDVAYAEVASGATITFTTSDPDLVEALHAWGEAQVLDHGEHAEHAEHADQVDPDGAAGGG